MVGVVADVDVQSESEGPRCSFAERSSLSRMLGTPDSRVLRVLAEGRGLNPADGT